MTLTFIDLWAIINTESQEKSKKERMKMLISEKIARMIEEMLEAQNEIAEIQRNEFASRMGCVPSQINYVISSRFNKQHGYIVESRRGGGGYIKITRVNMGESEFLMHLFATIGKTLDFGCARSYLVSMFEYGIFDEKHFKLFSAMLSDRALACEEIKEKRDMIRADLMKTLILSIM